MNEFQITTSISFGVEINQVALGGLVDPESLLLYLLAPDGTETTLNYPTGPIIRDSLGMFHVVFTVTQSGTWNRQWQAIFADGTSEASPMATFTVDPSLFIVG